jgi:hypothetical protein
MVWSIVYVHHHDTSSGVTCATTGSGMAIWSWQSVGNPVRTYTCITMVVRTRVARIAGLSRIISLPDVLVTGGAGQQLLRQPCHDASCGCCRKAPGCGDQRLTPAPHTGPRIELSGGGCPGTPFNMGSRRHPRTASCSSRAAAVTSLWKHLATMLFSTLLLLLRPPRHGALALHAQLRRRRELLNQAAESTAPAEGGAVGIERPDAHAAPEHSAAHASSDQPEGRVSPQQPEGHHASAHQQPEGHHASAQQAAARARRRAAVLKSWQSKRRSSRHDYLDK